MPESIEVNVERIIFSGVEDYKIISCAAVQTAESEFVALGTMPYLKEGDKAILIGKWEKHSRHGVQFKVSQYTLKPLDTLESVKYFLKSGQIKGVGKKTGQRIIDEFGETALDIITQEPEKLVKVKGISKKKALDIAEQLKEKKDFQELTVFLNPFGIGMKRIAKINEQWGQEAIQKIKLEPYCLVEEIKGIGFETADQIALQLNYEPEGLSRIKAGAEHILLQHLKRGHTWMDLDLFTIQLAKLLKIAAAAVQNSLPELSLENPFIFFNLGQETIAVAATGEQAAGQADDKEEEKQGIALAKVAYFEKNLAHRINFLREQKPETAKQDQDYLKRSIDRAANQEGFILADEQKAAILMALEEKFMVLTGGPGTGKTTIIKILANLLAAREEEVIMAAPTGRAARRLTEITNCEAQTIHRLLALQIREDNEIPSYNYAFADLKPLEGDWLIIDESSMIDLFLFGQILSTVPPDMHVVLIGDMDQLPSIGPGQVLRDIIESEQVPCFTLKKIFRQAEGDLIVQNAHRIKEKRTLLKDNQIESSFLLSFIQDETQMADTIIKLYEDILPKTYGFHSQKDIQILTAMHRGSAGTIALNRQIQEAERGAGFKAFNFHEHKFAVGDKVIQTKNQYDISWVSQDGKETGKGVMNGEMGEVIAINFFKRTLEILFEEEHLVEYSEEYLEELELAYAITIHKSQGSEYPCVILAIPQGSPDFLSRNLLYTAVTRAKQKIIVLSRERIWTMILQNDRQMKRQTLLPYFFRNAKQEI